MNSLTIICILTQHLDRTTVAAGLVVAPQVQLAIEEGTEIFSSLVNVSDVDKCPGHVGASGEGVVQKGELIHLVL